MHPYSKEADTTFFRSESQRGVTSPGARVGGGQARNPESLRGPAALRAVENDQSTGARNIYLVVLADRSVSSTAVVVIGGMFAVSVAIKDSGAAEKSRPGRNRLGASPRPVSMSLAAASPADPVNASIAGALAVNASGITAPRKRSCHSRLCALAAELVRPRTPGSGRGRLYPHRGRR